MAAADIYRSLEGKVHRVFAIIALGLLGLVGATLPVSAAGNQTHQHAVDWSQHDTAVYVVSTLNVLHTRRGQPVVGLMSKRLGIVRYDVWSDLDTADLYFIQLKKTDGTGAGTLAYQMGWPQPLSISRLVGRLGVHSAPSTIADAFRTDPKQLIGTFTSTLPQ